MPNEDFYDPEEGTNSIVFAIDQVHGELQGLNSDHQRWSQNIDTRLDNISTLLDAIHGTLMVELVEELRGANASRWREKISTLLERIGTTLGELPREEGPFEDPNERVVNGLTEINDALNELRDTLNELKAELAHNLPQIVQTATLFSTGCMTIGMLAIRPQQSLLSLSALTLRIRLFHIADDGLPAVIHMNMLDADNLMSAVTQASENLHLRRIRLHQTSRSRPVRRYSPLRCECDVQLGENRHGRRVRAGHLDGERSLNFVLRRCSFDHRERGIHRQFRNAAKGRTTRSLYLEQRGVHEVARRCAESFIQSSPPIFALAIRRMHFCQFAIRPPHLDADWWESALASHWSR
jgi:hypothetical protein